MLTVFLIRGNLLSNSDNPNTLNELNLRSEKIKSLRSDIRKTIRVTKSKIDPAELPDLKFYKYSVKKGDTFWKILTKTSLNMDTLITVNFLTSPADIKPGKTLYIPNMRGVLYKVKKDEGIYRISNKFEIEKEYICRANRITEGTKSHMFIPCAGISNVERSLFLGVGFANPLEHGRRTSSFGRRVDPFSKKLRFHNGVDLACTVGSKVYASRDGVVSFTGYNGGYGKLIIVRHSHGYQSYYGHLSKFSVKAGKKVKRGDLLGFSGNTGRTTGPHLHFEIRKKTKPINPGTLLR